MEQLLHLNTASNFQTQSDSDEKPLKITYKTGASFEGNVEDFKKTGKGIFTWPNSSKYEGDFVGNRRHGTGVQLWADGTQYDGDFINDLRHGQGCIHWSNHETYKGAFFKDRRHGKGQYSWPDGSSYIGTFYMDKKEGYGIFSFSNGNKFEGLYKDDEREGPGVMTYQNGEQDVGFWRGEKLIRLLTTVEGAFTMKNHPEFEFEEENKQIAVTPAPDRIGPLKNILHPPALFDYTPEANIYNRINELFIEDIDPRSLAVNRQTFDAEFFKHLNSSNEIPPHVMLAWNKTPTFVDMQRHIQRHHGGRENVSFNVDDVLKFVRKGFNDSGVLEQASEELIKMAAAGNAQRVEELLSFGNVHPDVADRNGFTALIAATVNWHQPVINVLLNLGANVNQISDEGVSALAAGFIFYYPIDSFCFNIAERYLVKPPSEEKVSIQATPRTNRSNNKDQNANKLNQLNHHKSEITIQLSSKESNEISAYKSYKSKPSVEKSQVKILDSKTQSDEKSEKIFIDNVKDSLLNEEKLDDTKGLDENKSEEFESNTSVHNFQIEVTDALVERCATQLSMNEKLVSQEFNNPQVEKAWMLARKISHHEQMKTTLELLLQRGANPNASAIPMPVLSFAVKAADVNMVRSLLMKGAATDTCLSEAKGGLAPLHIAAALPGQEGVEITKLLLDALADPDFHALEDDSFLNRNLEEEWSKDVISKESVQLLGGRTPLQIACARDDNYVNAFKVVRLLLEHKANPNLMCNGFSPLALAISSGNNLAINELLLHKANPSLALTHGVGNALCVATSPEYEHRRTIQGRIDLINQLIKAGADILAPIPIGPKRLIGTAVDYAFYMFNLDRRISHMPYHALTPAERETYNARKKLLAHIGEILRHKAVEKERIRVMEEEKESLLTSSHIPNFIYTGTGATLKGLGKAGQVTFDSGTKDNNKKQVDITLGQVEGVIRSEIVTIMAKDANEVKRLAGQNRPVVRKPLFKYCYECGRSVGVRLSACTRCKKVYYCSKACKLKAWNALHKDECIRVGARSRSASPSGASKRLHSNSPTSSSHTIKGQQATVASHTVKGQQATVAPHTAKGQQATVAPHTIKGQQATVAPLNKDKKNLRILVPVKDLSHSAKSVRTIQESRDSQKLPDKRFRTENDLLVYIDNYSYN